MRQGCKYIVLGETTAIMCGGEAGNHKCDEKDFIYLFSDGFRGTLFEKTKNEKLNLNMCDADKIYFLAEKDIHITGGSVACSICGRAEIDNAYWL